MIAAILIEKPEHKDCVSSELVDVAKEEMNVRNMITPSGHGTCTWLRM